MVHWTVTAQSFPPAHRIPDTAVGALPQPPLPDKRSMADRGSLVRAHRAPDAAADRIRYTQSPRATVFAAPTISTSFSFRPVHADTPDNQTKPESPSTLYASTAECSRKRDLTEPSIVG